MQSASIPAAGTRSEANKKFANDGSFESVDRMLQKLAFKCFARVQALGLGMTLDDVRQEMNVSYVQARKLWEPDRGVLFVSYMTTACYRNFNERIRKAELERRNLGLVNFSDMSRRQPDGQESDCLEYTDLSETSDYMQITQMMGNELISGSCAPGALEAPISSDPSIFLEEVQEFYSAKNNAKIALANLTPKAKQVIIDLLCAERDREEGKRLPSLRSLFVKRSATQAEIKRIRAELARAFKVKF